MKIVTKVISITLASLLLLTPIVAQQSQLDACTQANIDAKNDTNETLWVVAGCLFGIFGLGAAFVIEPSPHAVKLIGKDADYVAVYTDCYRSSAKKIQTTQAWTGCLGSCLGLLAASLLNPPSNQNSTY